MARAAIAARDHQVGGDQARLGDLAAEMPPGCRGCGTGTSAATRYFGCRQFGPNGAEGEETPSGGVTVTRLRTVSSGSTGGNQVVQPPLVRAGTGPEGSS